MSSKVRTDFREYRRSEAPEDWESQFQTVESEVIRSSNVPVDRNRLSVWLPDGATGFGGLRLSPLPASARIHALVRLQMRQHTGGPNVMWLRASGDKTGVNGVVVLRLISDGFQEFFVRKYVGGVQGPPLAIAASSVPTMPMMMIMMRVELTAAGIVRWKAWPAGYTTEEPEAWDAEADVEASGSPLPSTGYFALAAQAARRDVMVDAVSLAWD